MTDHLTDSHWWQAHEKWLRYQSHATAASVAASHPATPFGLRRELLERSARFSLLAAEAREHARLWES